MEVVRYMNLCLQRSKTITALVACAFLTACSSTPKTEFQQYQDLQTSFTYTSYEALSKVTVTPLVKVLNYKQPLAADLSEQEREKKRQMNERHQVDVTAFHGLLSAIHSLQDFCTWSTAEADMAVKRAKNSHGEYIANSALSMAMQCNNWPGLAQTYEAKASLLENGKSLDKRHETMRLVAKTILGMNAVKNGNGPAAQNAFEELAEKINEPWIPVAVHGAAIIVDGPGISSVSKIRALLKQDGLTYTARQKLKQLELIAAKGEDKPEVASKEASELVGQWSLEGLKALGEITLDATVVAIAKVMRAYSKQ